MEANSRTNIASPSSETPVTFGEGVPRTEDTFAQVLEDTLNQQQRAMVCHAC